jgi:hypothetical protein
VYGAGGGEEAAIGGVVPGGGINRPEAARETGAEKRAGHIEASAGGKAVYPKGGSAAEQRYTYPIGGMIPTGNLVYSSAANAEEHVYVPQSVKRYSNSPRYGEKKGIKYTYSDRYDKNDPNNGYVITEYVTERKANVEVSQPYTVRIFLKRLFNMVISALGGGRNDGDIPRQVSRNIKKILPDEARYEDGGRLSAYLSEWDEENVLEYVNSLAAEESSMDNGIV